MHMDRRDLIKTMTGVSVMMAGLSGGMETASAAEVSPLAPLIAAGLDPLTVYRKMSASADKNEGCYWLYSGAFYVQIDDVGPVYFRQEESMLATQTEDINPDSFRISQRIASVFRDMQTGNPVIATYDPVTGVSTPHKGSSRIDPSHNVVSKNGDNLAFALVYHTAPVLGVTAAAEIKGDRVALTTRTEVLMAPNSKQGQISILKIYSSLAELKSGAPYVASEGFYSMKDTESGKLIISGVMQKAKVDEKLNPLAWDRTRGFFPDFFDGDRVAMNWK